MRRPKKPTYAQKVLIKSWRLNPDNWMVRADTVDKLVIINRHTDTIKEIMKKKEAG